MAKFAWDFLISDVPPSFVKSELQPIQTRFLKKWVGLAERADPSILYRSREQAGLSWKDLEIYSCPTSPVQREAIDGYDANRQPFLAASTNKQTNKHMGPAFLHRVDAGDVEVVLRRFLLRSNCWNGVGSTDGLELGLENET